MTTDLNFEAESFGGFPGSHDETFGESEVVVRDHRTGVPVRSGMPRGPAASRQVFGSPRAAAVRDHRWRGGAPFGSRHMPGFFRGGPGYNRGLPGRPFESRRWYGGSRFPFGAARPLRAMALKATPPSLGGGTRAFARQPSLPKFG